MSRPNVETFSGSHQSSIGSPYLPFISKLTFVVCPPFTSTSLLTLSFSTTGAPLYLTSTSTVPPPWAPTPRGPTASIAALPTSASAVSVTTVLRMDRPPAFLSSLLDCARPRRAHDHPQHREREKSDSGRNEEPAIRLRLLQPQIVPRGQRHLGAGLPRATLPRLKRDRREHARAEARPLGTARRERTLHHERVLAVLEHRFARCFAALHGRQLRRTVRGELGDALALLPAQQIDAVGGVTHQEIRPLGSRRLLRGELQ